MLREKIGLGLLLIVASILAITNNWLHRMDGMVFNIGQEWFLETRVENLAIISIDREDLNRHGPWPWPREVQAELIRKICNQRPKVLIININYEKIGDVISDQVLAKQISACGNVVLPVKTEHSIWHGMTKEIVPNKIFADAAKGVGQIRLHSGMHGGGYGVDFYEGGGTPNWPMLVKVVLDIAGKTERHSSLLGQITVMPSNPYSLTSDEFRLINHGHRKNTYLNASASHLMANLLPNGLLADKIVLLGPSWYGDDQLSGGESYLNKMGFSESELIANYVSNVQNNKLIAPLNEPAVLMATALLAIVPFLIVTMLSPQCGLMACVVWAGLVITGTSMLPVYFLMWLPPSGAIFAALLAYPIWSWRRLEVSQRYLDWQLCQLSGEGSQMQSLGYEQRISRVEVAQVKYKNLQRQRDEMLAFFSHDIRAPLAIVASQISGSELPDSVKQRLLLQLNRAHDLAQGFLSLIRAQSVIRSSFEDVDLITILHQSVDGFYEKALQQKIQLVRELPDDPIWINGDFGLLQRAFENLLGNALKYAPAYSEILIRVEVGPDRKIISVIDSGPGVSPDSINKLFEKFSTKVGEKNGVKGNGLGLYFVHTVAQQHGAHCGYSPRTPHGAHFWIEFKC